MNKMKKEQKENSDFLRTELTFALVLRSDLETVQEIKKYLSEKEDVEIVYQTTDSGKLYITRKEEAVE